MWVHDIDPVLLSLGSVQIHWYGVMYLIGFSAAWYLGIKRAARPQSGWSNEQVSDLIFYAALGVILGGRFGYVLFYNFDYFISDPLWLFAIWQGGMSFHGGLLGVTFACWLWSRQQHKSLFEVSDFIAPLVPIGLAAGRFGNFIGGELWGRVTDVPWAVVFPNSMDGLGRHPSQLYQLVLEGLLLFVLLWWFSHKPRPRMAVSGLFLIGYASARILVEFVREPDTHLGFLAMNWLTMGQLLSMPMLAVGMFLLGRAYKRC